MTTMNFVGTADGEEFHIKVDDHDKEDGKYHVTINDKVYKVDAQTMPSEIVTALINNKSYDLELDEKDQSDDPLDGRLSIRVRGRVLRLEMLEERRKKMKDAQSTKFNQSGIVQVAAPMPGKVLRYLVKEGQNVTEGEGLVVIEAMKMENEIRASKAGTIASILVQEGQAVEAQTVLMTID